MTSPNREACNVSLHKKLDLRSGRIQLIIAALNRLSQVINSGNDDIEAYLDDLVTLAVDYGPEWLSETSNLLKEMYNRRLGS